MDCRFRFRRGRRILVWACFVTFCLPGSEASAAMPCSPNDPAAPGEEVELAASNVCDLPEPNTSFPVLAPSCDTGGFGASSCDLYLTISVGGFGGDTRCGVSCADGFYACCNNATFTRSAKCSCEVSPPPIASFPNPGDPFPLYNLGVAE
jgi:hypothetical protein